MRLFTDENLAVAALWAETRGESLDGKIAVAEVIRERTRRRYTSAGTIASTLFWPYQFSAFNTDNHWRPLIFELDNIDAVVRECFEAWQKSETTDLTHRAVLYANVDECRRRGKIPSWAREDKFLVQVGQHSFFSD